MELYVDGVLQGTYALGEANYFNDYITVGKYTNTTYYTNINLSNLRIYNRALTSSEIFDIYNEEKPKFYPDALKPGVLKTTRTYEDIEVQGRSIKTKVELKAIGTKMIDLDFDVYKIK
jgi:hypothetical protein